MENMLITWLFALAVGLIILFWMVLVYCIVLATLNLIHSRREKWIERHSAELSKRQLDRLNRERANEQDKDFERWLDVLTDPDMR